jgi:hypothetical protein
MTQSPSQLNSNKYYIYQFYLQLRHQNTLLYHYWLSWLVLLTYTPALIALASSHLRLLRRHERVHEVRELCPDCSKYFKTVFQFTQHRKTHTAEVSTQTSPVKAATVKRRRNVPKSVATIEDSPNKQITPSPTVQSVICSLPVRRSSESHSARECGTTTPVPIHLKASLHHHGPFQGHHSLSESMFQFLLHLSRWRQESVLHLLIR